MCKEPLSSVYFNVSIITEHWPLEGNEHVLVFDVHTGNKNIIQIQDSTFIPHDPLGKQKKRNKLKKDQTLLFQLKDSLDKDEHRKKNILFIYCFNAWKPCFF